MNKRTISTVLGITLLYSIGSLIGMDEPLHTHMNKIVLNNNSRFDITYKFAKPEDFADEQKLLAGKLLEYKNTPTRFSIKRSGVGDMFSPYTGYNLLELVTKFVNNNIKDPAEMDLMRELGSVPMIVFEVARTYPFDWVVSVKWSK